MSDEQIVALKEGQAKHSKVLEEQSLLLLRIHTAIIGDEAAGVDGLVKETKANSAYIAKDKKFKWTVAGMLTSIVSLKDTVIEFFTS